MPDNSAPLPPVPAPRPLYRVVPLMIQPRASAPPEHSDPPPQNRHPVSAQVALIRALRRLARDTRDIDDRED